MLKTLLPGGGLGRHYYYKFIRLEKITFQDCHEIANKNSIEVRDSLFTNELKCPGEPSVKMLHNMTDTNIPVDFLKMNQSRLKDLTD